MLWRATRVWRAEALNLEYGVRHRGATVKNDSSVIAASHTLPGLFQDGNVGISIFPERQKVLIRGPAFRASRCNM